MNISSKVAIFLFFSCSVVCVMFIYIWFHVQLVTRNVTHALVKISSFAHVSHSTSKDRPIRLALGENGFPADYCQNISMFLVSHLSLFYAQASGSSFDGPRIQDMYKSKYIYTDLSEYPFGIVFGVPEHDTTVIMLRGTRGRRESQIGMRTDCDVFQQTSQEKMHKYIRFHKGFMVQYMLIKRQLIDCMLTFSHKRLLLCGHSLGAAIINLVLYDFVSNRVFSERNVYAINYGSPRTGNREYAAWVERRGIRLHTVQNSSDVFSNIPLPTMPVIPFSLIDLMRIGIIKRKRVTFYCHAGNLHLFCSVTGSSLMDYHSILTYEKAVRSETRLVHMRE